MLNIFKKTTQASGTTINLKLSGLHCTSCALNIDGTLEETEGIIESNTNYAKSEAKIVYTPEKITPDKIKKIIHSLGYTAS